ncbi:MAG: hypothetical protein AAB038_02975 [Planctomycetota bacterium]
MKKHVYYMLAVLFLVAFIATFGGCGGGGSSSGSSAPAAPSLKITGLDLGKAVSLKAVSGDPGSSVDSFRVKINSVELQKDDASTATVYSGITYLETVGTTDEIAGILNGSMPPIGVYTGVTMTVGGFMIKAKIISGATTYYTTNQTIGYESGISWTLSTSLAAYDHITITSTGFTMFTEFPSPLTVTGSSSVNLVWASELNGIVTCDGFLPNDVTWVNEEEVIRATLPCMPSTQIQFPLTALSSTASAMSNTITFLLDSSGNLLGGFCHRPANKAINGSDLKSGSLSNVSNNGNTATFDVSFWDGNGTGWYRITGSYDCGTGTSGTYSSLTVTAQGGVTADYLNKGHTLETTGSVTSK